jgi:hypothetical protein
MTAPRRPTIRFNRPIARRAWSLCALGVLAVLMHTLAAIGLIGSHQAMARGNADTFSAAICSVVGATANAVTDATSIAGNTAPQPAHGNPHDCCKLCVAAAPLLLADVTAAVPPAPTFHAAFAHGDTTRPATTAWTAHPPRGPPRV